tara:strand:- start:906 stop:1082 length:177 start_codon:yes stop_codon:yes gene_type:complete
MIKTKLIKQYADDISFRLLATNKTIDQPWLEEKLEQLCLDMSKIDKNSKKLKKNEQKV